MLVLFKPWRSYTDLKSLDMSWCQAFEQYGFLEKQRESMDHFYIQYECNEPRDDFQASRAAKGGYAKSGADMDSGIDKALSSMFSQLGDDVDENLMDSEKGKTTQLRDEDMQLMECRAFTVGWLDSSVDGIPPTDLTSPLSGEQLSTKEWGTLLENEKMKRLEERMNHMPLMVAKPVSETWYEEGCPTDNVYPIDSSYLLKSFKPKDSNVLSDMIDVMRLFQLNKEQQRAYHLIVNHCVTPNGG